MAQLKNTLKRQGFGATRLAHERSDAFSYVSDAFSIASKKGTVGNGTQIGFAAALRLSVPSHAPFETSTNPEVSNSSAHFHIYLGNNTSPPQANQRDNMWDTIASTTQRAESEPRYGSLKLPAARSRFEGLKPAAKAQEFECVTLTTPSFDEMAPIGHSQRSVSCFELGSSARRFRTIRIGRESEDLRLLSEANVKELILTASSKCEADSNNARLARKALRYRKIWSQSNEDPASC